MFFDISILDFLPPVFGSSNHDLNTIMIMGSRTRTVKYNHGYCVCIIGYNLCLQFIGDIFDNDRFLEHSLIYADIMPSIFQMKFESGFIAFMKILFFDQFLFAYLLLFIFI